MSLHGSLAASDVSAADARRTPPTPPPVWKSEQVKLTLPLENAYERLRAYYQTSVFVKMG